MPPNPEHGVGSEYLSVALLFQVANFLHISAIQDLCGLLN